MGTLYCVVLISPYLEKGYSKLAINAVHSIGKKQYAFQRITYKLLFLLILFADIEDKTFFRILTHIPKCEFCQNVQ